MGLLASVVLFAPGTAAAFADVAASPQNGGTVYIGAREGYGGTGLFPVYAHAPADPGKPGAPDLWAYCIEHDVHALTGINGTVGDLGSYLGANRFTDPTVQSKVLWVLAHSYPALSLEEFGTAAGVPGISRNDAIEATQYAIWRYTELDHDGAWPWENADSKTAYYHLLAGANASTGMTPAEAATTISISAPSTPQDAGTIVGPFVVTTNRPTVSVSVDPAATLTDANGAVLDPTSIVDGQALYLDLRGTSESGTATITATAAGSTLSGHVVSVPTAPGGTPTAANHAQSIVLVAPSGATRSAEAVARWNTTGGATPSASPSVSVSPTGGATSSASPSVSASPTSGATSSATPSVSASPTNGATSSATPSVSASPTNGTTGGSATGSTTGGATSSASPSVSLSPTSGATSSATPSVSASPTPGGALAKTGSSGAGVITGIAAALVVVGGGVLFTVRRRRSARH
ncbi:Cys-Gln thioester bond-forming surface protein [Kitasatospora sp. NPDC058032]|uniref:Cys-Gln thioester bond-forming surface protein n=1 Tax=Kitasatospora sp. NPDC058032 TaxID=3346307 RepID=UPI0036DE415F